MSFRHAKICEAHQLFVDLFVREIGFLVLFAEIKISGVCVQERFSGMNLRGMFGISSKLFLELFEFDGGNTNLWF